jgi:arsenate reductase (thioredoxin)
LHVTSNANADEASKYKFADRDAGHAAGLQRGNGHALQGDAMRPERVSHTNLFLTALVACVVSSAGLAAVQSPRQAPAARSATTGRPPTVLFICPHGAAKSVLASAYFERAAKERGLNVRVVTAGIDPDAQVAPAVANHLTRNGYSVPAAQPRRVTADDVAGADVVISIGCDMKGLPAPRGVLMKWDEVPSPSEDFAGADEAIRKRVIALVEELVRKPSPR